ncbi:hypothetical protein JT358_02050 [Micrococcales bacterium 31B]|nr:hypothetical protein [Micrococcales bacterium 31B]
MSRRGVLRRLHGLLGLVGVAHLPIVAGCSQSPEAQFAEHEVTPAGYFVHPDTSSKLVLVATVGVLDTFKSARVVSESDTEVTVEMLLSTEIPAGNTAVPEIGYVLTPVVDLGAALGGRSVRDSSGADVPLAPELERAAYEPGQTAPPKR